MDNQNQQRERRKGAVDYINSLRSVNLTLRTVGQIVTKPFPWVWIVVIIILLIVIFQLFFGGGTGLSFDLDDSQDPNLPGGPGSQTSPGLNYYIPFRDSSVVPLDLKDYYANLYPNSQISNWDLIIDKSKANGWNPAFILTLWIEETHAQTPPYSDALGCNPSNPTADINVSLQCVFGSFGGLTNDRFDDFMCTYGGDNFSDAPCMFTINPNFPSNIRDIYSKLVPGGPGALVEIVPPPPAPGLAGSCPISGGASQVTCGSRDTPRAGCGHCNAEYQRAFPNVPCNYPEILGAIDIGGGQNQAVYLPTLGGQNLRWTFWAEEASGIGYRIIYRGDAPDGKLYWLRFIHVDQGSGTSSGMSGSVGARICTTNRLCNHVHVEFANLDTSGRTAIDAAATFCR